MKPTITIVFAAAIVGASALGITAAARRGPRINMPLRGKTVPVLVELFTSEGCSSCPSADDLLRRLQREQPTDGALIIPLSEHVDYWNGSAWRDRFSAAIFSSRQAQYVQAMHLEGPYTPQMVVDGQAELVGSDEGSALTAISEASAKRKADVMLTVAPAGTGSMTVQVSVHSLPATRAEADNEVYLAVAENSLESHVRGGENGGRTLSHTAVVRVLKKIGEVQRSGSFEKDIPVSLDPSWKTRDLSFVAFVQAPHSRRILGVGLASLTKQ